jgi:hypothetical protein
LNSNFLRPYLGYQDINYLEFVGTGNYNSLQVQLTKRFSNNLTYHMAYTWSKALNLVDGQGGTVNPVLSYKMRNYGLGGYDRRHNLMLNYVYNLPHLGKNWNHPVSRILLDGWQVSGICTFMTGSPGGIGYSLSYSADLTGGTGNGLDSRVVVVDVVNKPGPNGQRFNVNAIKPPTSGNSVNGIGNAAKVLFTNPGLNNWDIALFKDFRLGAVESRRLQFRWETYNTFNHTQYTGVDTGSRWDAAGSQINTILGFYTGAALSRRMQFGLKLFF